MGGPCHRQKGASKSGGKRRSRANIPVLVPVHYTGYYGVDICGCADEEEDGEEE